LVLTVANMVYLEQCFGAGGRWTQAAPTRLKCLALDYPQHADEEAVVVCHFEDTPSLQGYKPASVEHKRVLGFRAGKGALAPGSASTPVHNLRHLAQAVLACHEGDICLEMHDSSIVVMPAAQAKEDMRMLLKEYEVQSCVSADLRDLLTTRKAAAAALTP
jgi:hypothetical protein